MATKRFSLSIFHKLLFTLLAVSIIPLVALWGVGSNQVQKDVSTEIANKLMMTSSSIAAGITSWDDTNVRVLRSANAIEDITGMDPARQRPVLRAFGGVYEWAFVIYTTDEEGTGLARSDDKPMTKFGDRTYFQETMKGAPLARQVLISKSTGKPALTLGVPVKNNMGGTVGVLAMAMKLDDISKVIKDTRIGETGYAILLDADNKMIASGRPDKSKDAVQDMADYPAMKVDGIADMPTVYESDGKRMVGYMRKLPQGWTLLVEQEHSEAYASLARLENGARFLIMLTAAIVFGVAWFLGKQLTRPINQLIVVAEHLSTGNFEDDVPGTERGDEIGALARAVERLGVSIRMAMERLRRKA